MIYAIQEGVRGPIKIGCSSDPIGRLRTFEIRLGKTMRGIGVMHGSFGEEGAIHRKLAEDRIVERGREWFWPSPQVLKLVTSFDPFPETFKEGQTYERTKSLRPIRQV